VCGGRVEILAASVLAGSGDQDGAEEIPKGLVVRIPGVQILGGLDVVGADGPSGLDLSREAPSRVEVRGDESLGSLGNGRCGGSLRAQGG
jgi:hypothetical protein